MSTRWNPAIGPAEVRITPMGWLRAGLRGAVLAATLLAGLILLLAVRLFERPVCGTNRPITPHITQFVCRAAFVILQMRHRVQGRPMRHPGAVVSNHASWLDIFALNARKRVYFVSKSEVAEWPGIGFLAKSVGTVFIARDPRQAAAQKELFKRRLLAGHKLLFFPEGTSSDGMRVLPFKPTLFEAFLSAGLRERLFLQPVTVIYTAPEGQDPRFYGWWGETAFGPHLLTVLAARRQGAVQLIYHAPVRVADFGDRKALARHLEQVVRAAMPPARQIL